MTQLSYNYDHPVAFEGMGADTTPKQDESFFSDDTSNEIPFGRVVQQGAADNTCRALTAITNKLVGIALHSHSYDPGIDLGPNGGVLAQGSVNVRKWGRIYVITEENVTPADPVYIRALSGGGGTAIGRFRKTVESSNLIKFYGASWITSGTAGGLVMLEFDVRIHNAKVAS